MKKLLLLLMLGMFMVSLVSAFDFDNGLEYFEEDMKVVFENGYFFGIGEWFGLNRELGTIELKSHSSLTEIKKVG